MLRAAEADRHVDAHRVFLYGWSEGSTVAAALAASHPELAGVAFQLAGVAFQGPVDEPWRDVFTYPGRPAHGSIPARFAVDDTWGPVGLKHAFHGGGGLVATSWIGYVPT